MVSDIELAYAAGMFDGEGSLALTRNTSARWPSPQVSVSTTDCEVTSWLKQRFGGVVAHKRTYAPKHRPAFDWKLTDRKALTFLAQVRPFLVIERKIQRCDLLLREYVVCTPRNGRYSPEMAGKKRALMERFASLP
jgi:hypothetical protein